MGRKKAKKEQIQEKFDSIEDLQHKVQELAHLISNYKHVVIHAGIELLTNKILINTSKGLE